MMSLKVGDVVTCRSEGFKHIGAAYWSTFATVTNVDETMITCLVETPDGRRTMPFDAETGINTQGVDYGWLVEIAGLEMPIVDERTE